jgi:hypothetical protein
MRHVETFSGKGTVTAPEGNTQNVEYRIDVFQNEIADGFGGTIPGLLSIEGTVEPVCFFGERRGLTLKMKNDKILKFFFVDMSGRIATMGTIS